jgi:glutathione S-transferase
MELFTARNACSFGAHVVVHELALPIRVTLVGIGQPRSLIHRINPLGRVPALVLDDRTLLTENSAILPFLADLRPGTPLFAPAGSVERAQIQSWIGYVNSEVHAGALRAVNRPERYGVEPGAREVNRQAGLALLAAALAPIERHLEAHTWLVGERFTIADAYLGLFAGRARELFADRVRFAALERYADRFEQRLSVRAARMLEELELAA